MDKIKTAVLAGLIAVTAGIASAGETTIKNLGGYVATITWKHYDVSYFTHENVFKKQDQYNVWLGASTQGYTPNANTKLEYIITINNQEFHRGFVPDGHTKEEIVLHGTFLEPWMSRSP